MKKNKTALGWVRSICLLFAVVFSLSMAVDIPYVTTMEVQAASTTYSKTQAKKKAKTILQDKVKIKSSDSAKTKLKKIFKYTEKKWSYSRDYTKVTKSTWSTYAYEMMEGKSGGCYHWAAGFAVLAKQALGSKYTVRIAVGKTKGFGNGKQDHAWVEIKKKGGSWYICDPEMDKMMEDSSRKYFYVKRSKSSIKKTYCSYSKNKHYTISF